jgi:cobalamin-dependent methionine synthase I
MSPGYSYQLKSGPCEWSLDEQKALFDVFGEAKLPVKLMESCAMVPKMSRTGLYALRVASDIGRHNGGAADLSGPQ